MVWDQQVITDSERAMNGKAEGVALHLNGGPIVVNGKVIMGVSLGLENSPGGCFIVALDTATGKELWRFHTIARPGQPGGDSWNGAPVNERFGGGVWTAGSYDPELDLVYFGIGNTYNAATLLEPRPGTKRVSNNDGLYTDATVALRPDTGALVWHYQHHQARCVGPGLGVRAVRVTLPVNGKPRKLVVTGGKTAMFDAVDAATGAYVFSRDMGVQNLVTAVDPKTGDKKVNPAVQPEPGKSEADMPRRFGRAQLARDSLQFRHQPAVRADDRILHGFHLYAAQRCGNGRWRHGHEIDAARAAGQRRTVREIDRSGSFHRGNLSGPIASAFPWPVRRWPLQVACCSTATWIATSMPTTRPLEQCCGARD